MLDQLDQKLLKRIAENPGASVIDICGLFLEEKSESALRARIKNLTYLGLIRIEKTQDRVRCYPMARKPEA
jgi:predicted transcriptional regulator